DRVDLLVNAFALVNRAVELLDLDDLVEAGAGRGRLVAALLRHGDLHVGGVELELDGALLVLEQDLVALLPDLALELLAARLDDDVALLPAVLRERGDGDRESEDEGEESAHACLRWWE